MPYVSSKKSLTLLAFLTAAAILAGCGGGDDTPRVTCGENTQRLGDSCVLEEEPVSCAEGTTLTGGVCVPDVACGEGTTADASGACVPDFDDVECAEGTELDGTTCVPEVVCGEGTAARDGECLSDAEILADEADVDEDTDSENDPEAGGVAQPLSKPPSGNTLTVAGIINAPEDKDDDGIGDQDFDAYAFEASQGDYLRLEVLDNGSGSVGFVVRGPNDYLRVSPLHEAGGERELLLPHDGDYSVTVGPTAHLLDGSVGARGGEHARYVLAIENLGELDISAATAVDATAGETATGRFSDLSDNLIAIDAPADTMVRAALPKLGVDVDAEAIVFDADGDVIDTEPVDQRGLVRFPASDDDLTVLLDYVERRGERDAYTLEATIPSAETLPATLSAGATYTYDEGGTPIYAGGSLYLSVDVDLDEGVGGGYVEIEPVSDDAQALNYRTFDPDGEPLDGFADLGGFYAPTDGTYTLEIANTDTMATVELDSLEVRLYPVGDLGTLDASPDGPGAHTIDTIPISNFRLVTFEITEPVTATLDAAQGGSSSTLWLSLLTDDLGIIAEETSGVAAPKLADMPLLEPGRYLVMISNPMMVNDDRDAFDVSVTLRTGAPPEQESEPNATVATATVLAEDELIWAELSGGPMRDFDVFELATDFAEPTLVEANIRELDLTGAIAAELRDETGTVYAAGSTGTLSAVVQPGASYYLHVYCLDGFDRLSYAVDTSAVEVSVGQLEAEPNDEHDDAKELVDASGSASFLAGGTLGGRGDVDWFSFEQDEDGFAAIDITSLEGREAPTDISLQLYEDNGSGGLDEVDFAGPIELSAGTKYLEISGGSPSGNANTYAVRVSPVDLTDLGELPVDEVAHSADTFDGSGNALFSFEIADDLAEDDSQTAFFWSSATLEVLDGSGQPIYTAGAPGSGFSATELAQGTYFARIAGGEGAEWQIQTGVIATTTEQETGGGASNDTEFDAEDLGAFEPSSPLHVFGTVDDADANDWFSFEVPDGDAQDVVVAQMGLGSAINDTDWQLYADPADPPVASPFEIPQIEEVTLEPGVYHLKVAHWFGTDSGDYLVRIYPAP